MSRLFVHVTTSETDNKQTRQQAQQTTSNTDSKQNSQQAKQTTSKPDNKQNRQAGLPWQMCWMHFPVHSAAQRAVSEPLLHCCQMTTSAGSAESLSGVQSGAKTQLPEGFPAMHAARLVLLVLGLSL